MRPCIISKKATEDLEQIWQYTYFQWSEEQADKYYHLLMEKIALIVQNTTIGRKIDYIRAGYRCFPVESHAIFYKISKNNTITIIRILHQRMDAPNHL